jgi:hypothetical protein
MFLVNDPSDACDIVSEVYMALRKLNEDFSTQEVLTVKEYDAYREALIISERIAN